VEGCDVQKEEKGRDGGPLRGADGNWGGDVGGTLEDEGTGPLRQERGYQVDHIGGNVGGQKPGPEGGGVDVVEAGFDVQEEGGDLMSGSLKGFYLVCEGEAGVGGAEPGEGAALVRMEAASGFRDGR